MIRKLCLAAILCAALLLALPLLAQQQSSQQQADEGQAPAQSGPIAGGDSSTPSRPGETNREIQNRNQVETTGTSKDRLFFALPNFLTVESASQAPPLTAGEKFKVVARSTFDPAEFVWYATLSGLSLATNGEPGYGTGLAGYGRRFGSDIGDGTIENFWTGAILPSVLHQDPRFYQKGGSGFWRRTGYAMTRIVETRSDSGRHQFNFSEVFGAGIAAAISDYSYHPRSERNVASTASVWGGQLGYDAFTYMVKEFWPDIRRKLGKQPEKGS